MLRGEGVKRKNSLFKIRVSGKNSSEYQGERWIYFERISYNWYENRTNFSSYVKITTFHPWKDNTLLPLLPNGQTFSFLFQTAVHLARSKAGNSFHRPSIDPLPPPSLHINIHSTGRERGEGQTDTCLRTPEKPRSFVAAPFSSFDEKRTVRMDWRERGTIVLIEREVNSRRTSSESYRHSVVFSLDPFPSLPDRQTTNTCWVSLCDVLFVFLRFCKIYT